MNFSFPTIWIRKFPKSLKFGHWPSKLLLKNLSVSIFCGSFLYIVVTSDLRLAHEGRILAAVETTKPRVSSWMEGLDAFTPFPSLFLHVWLKKLLLQTELEWDYNGNMEHATLTPSFVKKSTRKCVMYLVKSKLSIQLHVVVSPCKSRLRAHHVIKKMLTIQTWY